MLSSQLIPAKGLARDRILSVIHKLPDNRVITMRQLCAAAKVSASHLNHIKHQLPTDCYSLAHVPGKAGAAILVFGNPKTIKEFTR